MAGLNKVMCIGNVGRDPEMRYTSGGKSTTQFSVAVSGFARDGEEPATEWFNIVTWDKLAENMNQLVRKGSKVYVEGRLQTRSWEGQDGQKKYRTEVVAQRVELLDGKPTERPAGRFEAPEPEDDTLPF